MHCKCAAFGKACRNDTSSRTQTICPPVFAEVCNSYVCWIHTLRKLRRRVCYGYGRLSVEHFEK
eukprot:2605815-Pleurochrysis_carterae.AAC.3